MSYEGSREYLCRNGHYACCDAYSQDDRQPCRICGESTVWRREIDETNGDAPEPSPLEMIEPARYAQCNLGHNHEISPPRWRVRESV